jgi:hypothetical protein
LIHLILLKELEIIGQVTKDLVWEVSEEILSVKLDHIVKVYLYDSAWRRIKSPPQNYGHADKVQKMSYATQVLSRHNHD